MPASDALHMRTTMVEDFEVTHFKVLLEQRLDSHQQIVMLDPYNEDDLKMFFSDGMKLALQASECFYVSPDMVNFAKMASEDFPLNECILREDAPSEIGFMRLGHPLVIDDLHGKPQRCHAILWRGSYVWIIGDRLDPEDAISADGLRWDPDAPRHWGRYDIIGLNHFIYNKPIPQSFKFEEGDIEVGDAVMVKDGRVSTSTMQMDLTDEEIEARMRVDPVLRWLLATWRLMQQTLTTVAEETPARAFRKRSAKVDCSEKVTVIQLRRHKGQQHEGEPISHINYRTPVRGHWRKVWCGPLDRPEERYQRAVYIHPFWRGPEGAPIIVRKRVNALVR